MNDQPETFDLSALDLPEGVRRVALADIVKDDALQVRISLDKPALKRYTDILKQGGAMEPIHLGDIDGALFLVDGWHRIEAHSRAGRGVIAARVEKMTREEATWAAASANLAHGVRLKAREMRGVFGAYVTAGRHRVRGGYKSYRDIGRELLVGHTTIRGWLKVDHPTIFRAMGAGADGGNSLAEMPPAPDPQPEFMRQAMEAADNLAHMARLLECPHDRADVIARVEAVLQELNLKPHEPRPDPGF